ncbi:hypothetical protein D3C85_881110 [compost metagenome]
MAVALVVAVGAVLNTLAVSLFTKPVYLTVNVGLAKPKQRALFSAIAVNTALFTVNEPFL